MKNIIGIHGISYSGKDTIAKNLIQICGKSQYERYAFADPIKFACNDIFGWNERHAFGDLKEVVDERFGVSPREAYQKLGTEWGRNLICDDLWLRIAEDRINKSDKSFIIPDFRFENELNWLEEKFPENHFMIFVSGRESQLSIDTKKHESENGIYHLYDKKNPRHIWIDNSGSLESLYLKCIEISVFFRNNLTYYNSTIYGDRETK